MTSKLNTAAVGVGPPVHVEPRPHPTSGDPFGALLAAVQPADGVGATSGPSLPDSRPGAIAAAHGAASAAAFVVPAGTARPTRTASDHHIGTPAAGLEAPTHPSSGVRREATESNLLPPPALLPGLTGGRATSPVATTPTRQPLVAPSPAPAPAAPGRRPAALAPAPQPLATTSPTAAPALPTVPGLPAAAQAVQAPPMTAQAQGQARGDAPATGEPVDEGGSDRKSKADRATQTAPASRQLTALPIPMVGQAAPVQAPNQVQVPAQSPAPGQAPARPAAQAVAAVVTQSVVALQAHAAASASAEAHAAPAAAPPATGQAWRATARTTAPATPPTSAPPSRPASPPASASPGEPGEPRPGDHKGERPATPSSNQLAADSPDPSPSRPGQPSPRATGVSPARAEPAQPVVNGQLVARSLAASSRVAQAARPVQAGPGGTERPVARETRPAEVPSASGVAPTSAAPAPLDSAPLRPTLVHGPVQVELPSELPQTGVQGAILPQGAHLRIETDTLGELALHLRVRDGVAHVRVEGEAAASLSGRAPELQRALAAEGIALGRLEVEPRQAVVAPAASDSPRTGLDQGQPQGQAPRQDRDDSGGPPLPPPPPARTPGSRTTAHHVEA